MAKKKRNHAIEKALEEEVRKINEAYVSNLRSDAGRCGGKKTLKNHGIKYLRSIATKGGYARMASLTPQERSELAKKAVDAREARRKKREG